ncbi:hypothetical protein [Empedobacter sedimenti]|uniref:hypothetical protein n=1 Tax=Empedobacter sedimenti TaxID=3042610 RepID=UPI0024A6CE11|nr:hypothetical protein [Empedobacter sedimenti]
MKRILFLFFLPIISFGQLSLKNQRLIKSLLLEENAESPHIGVGGNKSKVYTKFEKVKDKLSNDDLFYLAKNSNDVLRIYSSEELVYRDDNRIVELYKHYKDYPMVVSYTLGSVMQPNDLAQLIFDTFENIIKIDKSVTELLSEVDTTKINKGSPMEDWLIKQKEIKKLFNGNFNSNFEKIKKIKENHKDYPVKK